MRSFGMRIGAGVRQILSALGFGRKFVVHILMAGLSAQAFASSGAIATVKVCSNSDNYMFRLTTFADGSTFAASYQRKEVVAEFSCDANLITCTEKRIGEGLAAVNISGNGSNGQIASVYRQDILGKYKLEAQLVCRDFAK